MLGLNLNPELTASHWAAGRLHITHVLPDHSRLLLLLLLHELA